MDHAGLILVDLLLTALFSTGVTGSRLWVLVRIGGPCLTRIGLVTVVVLLTELFSIGVVVILTAFCFTGDVPSCFDGILFDITFCGLKVRYDIVPVYSS
jgi:hypothetical protein